MSEPGIPRTSGPSTRFARSGHSTRPLRLRKVGRRPRARSRKRPSRVAAGPGFEPGLAHSKCAGLPLADPAVCSQGLNPTSDPVIQTIASSYSHPDNTMILFGNVPAFWRRILSLEVRFEGLWGDLQFLRPKFLSGSDVAASVNKKGITNVPWVDSAAAFQPTFHYENGRAIHICEAKLLSMVPRLRLRSLGPVENSADQP